MDKLSKEELVALLAAKTDKPKKERKKPDLSDEKRLAMLERLAAMRDKVAENREKKKNAVVEQVKVKEADIDQVFEKKYGSKFDKMTELLSDLNENTKQVVTLKKEKAAKREIKPEPVAPPKPVVVAPPAPVAPPPPPKPVVQSHAPSYDPAQHLLPNRNAFKKGNTRF